MEEGTGPRRDRNPRRTVQGTVVVSFGSITVKGDGRRSVMRLKDRNLVDKEGFSIRALTPPLC